MRDMWIKLALFLVLLWFVGLTIGVAAFAHGNHTNQLVAFLFFCPVGMIFSALVGFEGPAKQPFDDERGER